MMHKKVILGAITFALGIVAYLILSRGDRQSLPPEDAAPSEAVRRFVTRPTTQGVQTLQGGEIAFKPGDQTMARVYDDVTGRLKYQFEAKTWEPISETDFRIIEPLIQIFMPHGEITYIQSDAAELTLARKGGNNVEPKRGWLKGNVRVTIDRTTADWREANPQRADRFAHPEALVNIDMDETRFDLDRAELTSKGDVLVDSSEVRIEGVRGLTLQWDQLDNRIDVLRFDDGGRMLLRRGGRMVDFALPGGRNDDGRKSRSASHGQNGGPPPPAPTDSTPRASDEEDLPRAFAMRPMSVDAVRADAAAEQMRFEGGVVVANRPAALPGVALPGQPPVTPMGQTQTERMPSDPRWVAGQPAGQAAPESASPGSTTRPSQGAPAIGAADAILREHAQTMRRKRVQSYRAVFDNEVLVEQKDGPRTIGRLQADRLEINFDFGEKQRSLARGSARPARAERPNEPTTTLPASRPAEESVLLASLEDDPTRLVLTWNGPLELRPLKIEASEQTGARFDVIATGRPVKVESEQGNARCDRLVYRNEQQQVWLAGTRARPVELAISESRWLRGREVFFDQERGLARIDGAGEMADERLSSAKELAGRADDNQISGNPSGNEQEGSSNAGGDLTAPSDRLATAIQGKHREPVRIAWSRGVDLELGYRTVDRINPETGAREQKRREVLKRAWFHGDVSITRGKERLAADELAVTFGLPSPDGGLADYIQHLNMAGHVRLQRGDEDIVAGRLDAEMILTPQGRNVPRTVDAEGGVRVRQVDREIRAEQMRVVLGEVSKGSAPASGRDLEVLGDARLGIERLRAAGDVYVEDPSRNLKIRRTGTLECSFRQGNQLVRASIAGLAAGKPARVRYDDFAVHGDKIEIDLDRESIDVPGPGKAWMVTRQDFTGRKLQEPAPVKTTWQGEMQFRLARNYGVFTDQVHSESQTFALDCDKLTIRFARVPPVRERKDKDLVERIWLLGEIAGDKAELKVQEPTQAVRDRKRPAYVVAEGKAQATHIERLPDTAEGEPGQLLSRLWVSGNQIVADLAREQMSVPGAGALVIEDYRFDLPGRTESARQAALGRGPLMTTLRNEGPSQTAVTWKNSMDFFVDRGLVAFDRDVSMVHRSGQAMVLRDELSKAMGISQDDVRRLGQGRTATLSCGNLLLDIRTTDDAAPSDSVSTPIRETHLKRLIAKGTVHLQEGAKSLMGEYLQYLGEVNEVRLEGTAAVDARITDQDEASQRMTMWRGPLLVWYREINRIEAPGATIRTSSR